MNVLACFSLLGLVIVLTTSEMEWEVNSSNKLERRVETVYLQSLGKRRHF